VGLVDATIDPVKHSPRTNSGTPARRKARVAAVIANAKAEGKKVPHGVKFIAFREPTLAERHFAKTLVPLKRKRSKVAA
jgi:hypothetical protein